MTKDFRSQVHGEIEGVPEASETGCLPSIVLVYLLEMDGVGVSPP